MIFFIFLFNILYMSMVYGTNTTIKTENKVNSAENFSEKPPIVQLAKTNYRQSNLLLSEGGVVDSLDLKLATKKNLSNIYNGDDADSKQIRVSKVKARNGVDNLTQSLKSNIVSDSLNNTATKFSHDNITSMLSNKNKNNDVALNSTLRSNNSIAVPTPVSEIMKPTILSHDKLVSIEKNLHLDSEPNIKINQYDKNSTLIIPIVISILVVPMFLVLTYFGVRRGQEAWKNRHYKRMDFLLDGMYND